LTIRRLVLFLLVCGSILTVSASPPVIGVAQSRGAFLINHASVPGTATILDGTSVQTLAASSDISLKSGARLTLGSNSTARVFQDRVLLESGAAELGHAPSYQLETSSLRIGAADPGTRIRVALAAGDRVRVAAFGGTAEIRNGQGILVARVLTGTALQLAAAPGNQAVLTGVVEAENGKFFLTDETTKVKVELRGTDLKKLVGKRVKVTGSTVVGETPSGKASQVVHVTDAAILAAGAAAAGAAAAGGAGAAAAGGAAAGAATAAGVSITTMAVVGGVAVGATVGGLAAAGTLGGSSASTVSR